MQTLSTVIAPIITWLVTEVFKINVPTFSPNRVLAIRMILAVVSLIIAVVSSWLFGNPFDQSLVGIAADAIINFVGATGVFHLASTESK